MIAHTQVLAFNKSRSMKAFAEVGILVQADWSTFMK
jgi:hypothetical protein